MKPPVTTVAFIGNPNVGKSALFNAITGAGQVIGNWCGKTTEACTVRTRYNAREFDFTDLPGIYGFGHSSTEELAVDKYLHAKTPDLIVAVVDALNLERNLYLVLEILERYEKAIIVLNKTDAATAHGIEINLTKLAEILGVPVISTVATSHNSAACLWQTITSSQTLWTPYRVNYPPDIEQAIERALPEQYSHPGMARWQKIKAVEKADEEKQTAIISARYAAANFITACCHHHHATESLTDKIDYWALHRWAGIPIMIAVFALLFFFTFTVSRPLSNLIGETFVYFGSAVHNIFSALKLPYMLTSLVADGLLNGIGAALGFLPQIAIFFLIYNIIQDSGYIVRVAILTDRLMSLIGLNGKIFIPLIAGYSCNVNGILASRILTSRYDRMVAMLASSYAPCSARLGVMVFMASAFFPSNEATLVMLCLLAISLGMMAVIAFLTRFFIAPEDSAVFMTEIPVYHLPHWRNLLAATLDRTLHFLKRIRNIIVYSSIIMWLLSSFPVGSFEQTYIARIGQIIEPLGSLLGLNWQLIVALIAGIPAKESALTTLGVIYNAAGSDGGLGQVLTSHITPLAAFTFLIVYMTYIPCLATVITIYQETKNWSVAICSVYGSIFLSILLGILSYNLGQLFL
ncbi:MAG: ferrous iron transporter FeoB [Firmicutes bacterium]|nr:ferrous iron transporter FeoB [Bacillota bacterium]